MTLAEAASHHVGVMCPITEGTKPFLGWAKRYWATWGGIVFPLYDPLGGVVGIEIRRLPGEVQPGQNPYADFQLDRSNGAPLAFGLQAALPVIWRTRKVVLVEGVFDYFGVRAAGTEYVVANLTANVAGPMRRFLGRYADVVVALLDMDVAGRAAAAKLAQVGREEGFLVVAPSYAGKDAGSLLQDRNLDALRALLTKMA